MDPGDRLTDAFPVVPFLNCGRDQRRGTRCFRHHADRKKRPILFRWLRPSHREPPRPSASLHPLRSVPAPPPACHHTMPRLRDRRRCRRPHARSCGPHRPGWLPPVIRGQPDSRFLADQVRRRSDGRCRFPRWPSPFPNGGSSCVHALSDCSGRDDRGNGDAWRRGAGPLGPGMAAFAPAERVTHTAVMPGRRV